MPARHLTFGSAGEDYAAAFLENRGYTIRNRNWRYRQWELDIICEKDNELVFVEVKTRAGKDVQAGVQAVTSAKRRSLFKAVSRYLTAMDLWDRPCRFDLVIVINDGNGFIAEHMENAFDFTDFMGSCNTAWQPW
ncbi:YraN family protein [Maridesulfovibrio sp.]|uniref:YraN family protein n=1 Tax=Maridesulfovibrio sp. TaxID=2795000 RepID=UPI002A18B579|nr:YraN family protein [Maridesulfovibrio sp.]